MVEENTGLPPADDVEDASPESGAAEVTQQQSEPESGNAEAARYRKQLRSAEGERDRLAELVTSYQSREVERQLGAQLETPADVWLTGTEVAELLDEDGGVDAEKVSVLGQKVLAEHPGWGRRPAATVDVDQGQRSEENAERSWSSVLKGGAQTA